MSVHNDPHCDRDLARTTINAYQGGDSPAAWEHVSPELLAIVHFHDCAPGPVDRLTLGSRLLPGEGVIDLAGFGSVLRELRGRRGVSQERLGHEAGSGRTYISQLERGQRGPSLKMVFRLAEVLGVAPAELTRKVERALTNQG